MNKNEMMRSAVAKEGYYFDFETTTLYMSTTWEKKSNQIGSKECEIRDQIESMFPTVKTEIIARKKSSTAIPYDMMRAYISIMPDADKNMAEFERQISMSKVFKSSYKYVAKWFETTYPNYGKMVDKDEEGNIRWNAVAEYKEAHKTADKGNIIPINCPETEEPAA